MTPEQETDAFRDWPEPEVCRVLASKIRKARVQAGETQAEFAARAGIPIRTYKRFELSGKATLENFIQVLRTLGRSSYLVYLFPSELTVRPNTVQTKIQELNLKLASGKIARQK